MYKTHVCPPNRGERSTRMGIPLRNRYFSTIGSSSVKTVADRHRLAVGFFFVYLFVCYAAIRGQYFSKA